MYVPDKVVQLPQYILKLILSFSSFWYISRWYAKNLVNKIQWQAHAWIFLFFIIFYHPGAILVTESIDLTPSSKFHTEKKIFFNFNTWIRTSLICPLIFLSLSRYIYCDVQWIIGETVTSQIIFLIFF